MIIRKSTPLSEEIEDFVNHWGKLIFDDLETVYRLMMSMWGEFSRSALNFGCWIVSKNKWLQCVYKIERI